MTFSDDDMFALSFKGRALGPFRLADIRRKYLNREIGGLHSLMHEGRKIPLSELFAPAPNHQPPQQKTAELPSADMLWIWKNGQREGPLTREEIFLGRKEGRLDAQDLYWNRQDNRWDPLAQLDQG